MINIANDQRFITYIAWMQVLIGTLGSLYASEILHWAPCLLCWYQRIFLYPLVFILPIGLFLKDKNLPLYVLPLTVAGMLIAGFHYLLQKGVVPATAAPCTIGVSCETDYINIFGFITIPLLSFFAFALITVLMWRVYKLNNKATS